MLLANKQYNFFEIHIVREIQELFYHTVSRHHTLSLRHSYDCRFMVKIIPVIRYTIVCSFCEIFVANLRVFGLYVDMYMASLS
jgi:hypothetical protein